MPTTTQAIACVQNGVPFFSKEDWQNLFGATRVDLAAAPAFPWTNELHGHCPIVPGKHVWETHDAFLEIPFLKGRPLTVSRWVEEFPRLFRVRHGLFLRVHNTHQAPRWCVMPKEEAFTEIGLSYFGSVKNIPVHYWGATLLQTVTRMVTMHRKYCDRGDSPRTTDWRWCSDLDPDRYGYIVRWHAGIIEIARLPWTAPREFGISLCRHH